MTDVPGPRQWLKVSAEKQWPHAKEKIPFYSEYVNFQHAWREANLKIFKEISLVFYFVAATDTVFISVDNMPVDDIYVRM